MDTIELIKLLTTLLSVIAAILAWIAKILWSKEYKEAKEAEISSLRTAIEMYEKFSPKIIREHYQSTIQQLSEINNEILERLDAARRETSERQKEIENLKKAGQTEKKIIKEKEEEKKLLEAKIAELAEHLNIASEINYDSPFIISTEEPITKSFIELYNRIKISSTDLAELMNDKNSIESTRQIEEKINNLIQDDQIII